MKLRKATALMLGAAMVIGGVSACGQKDDGKTSESRKTTESTAASASAENPGNAEDSGIPEELTLPLTEEKKELTVSNIKKCVADYYNLTVAQINSKSRTSSIIVARHIAMYLVRELIDDISFIQIGHEFGGRDHSTVMKACHKVQQKLEKDMNYRQAINDIKKKLV